MEWCRVHSCTDHNQEGMELDAAVSSNMICMKQHKEYIQELSITTTWFHARPPAPDHHPHHHTYIRIQNAVRPTCENCAYKGTTNRNLIYWVYLSSNVIAKKTNLNWNLF